MKANALTLIHKFIRAELFEVARIIATADPDDVHVVRAAVDEVIELLHQHAEHEEAGFEPHIRERNAAFADRMLKEHHALHAELDAIHIAVKAIETMQASDRADALLKLHLDWNHFLGGYLLHLDAEERTWFVGADSLMPPMAAMTEAPPGWSEEAHQSFLRKLYAAIAPGERKQVQDVSA